MGELEAWFCFVFWGAGKDGLRLRLRDWVYDLEVLYVLLYLHICISFWSFLYGVVDWIRITLLRAMYYVEPFALVWLSGCDVI